MVLEHRGEYQSLRMAVDFAAGWKLTHGGADKNLDWLNSDPQASAMCDRAEASERDLDPGLVVPADVGIQCCNKLLDGGGEPVAREEHLDLQSAKEALAGGVVR